MRDCKLRIMRNEMASELNVLARDAARVARQNPRTADFTRNILRRAIREIVACFPVYRTYVDAADAPIGTDRRDSTGRWRSARRNETEIDPSVFDFLAKLLSGELVGKPRSGFSRHAVLRLAMKLQQYSGPVMAKGLEDTAFYRYNRFIALNEVGGNPDQFGADARAFHKANRQRAALAARHARHLDPRHQARRGHPRAPRGAVGAAARSGRGRWRPGAASCARAAATSRARRRPTATTNTCSTRCWSAPGRWSCSAPTPDAGGVAAFAARIKGALTQVDARGEAALHLGRARHRL